jgi:hypothetical protein
VVESVNYLKMDKVERKGLWEKLETKGSVEGCVCGRGPVSSKISKI